MKTVFLICALFFSMLVLGQSEQLAQEYFEKGEFEKALTIYEELYRVNYSSSVYPKVVECYQQLRQFDKVEKIIEMRLNTFKQSNLLVDLGYNYQLQKKTDKAHEYYNKAIEAIRKNPNSVYSTAYSFETKVLLDYALKAYQVAIELNPNFNFNYQMALIYGQLGNTDMMIEKLLTYSYSFPEKDIAVQSQLSRFMSEDVDDMFSNMLRKALLQRAQKNQDIFWNKYLSWYYVQQKDYAKAFVQEKAIYKRNPETFSNIVGLAELAIKEDEKDTAREILMYILDNTESRDIKIKTHYFLTLMRIEEVKEKKDYNSIMEELEQLIAQFGSNPYTLSLQILQAHFLAFNLNTLEESKTILKKALDLQLNKYQIAEVKMELADILLYEENFNQALIYYSQIEEALKNDVVGHEASLKIAKTSYFKGDFDWAQKQLKELKGSFSQLTANDALELYLLINDNTVADSTQVALKKFAKADYLLYQNRLKLALIQFELILKEHKAEEIEDETLLRIGKIQEKLGNYDRTLVNYQKIIEEHSDGIYVDEALYFSAEIYNNYLKNPEKAKALYEKILFNHQDSIYFIDARKKYRKLRGDTIVKN